MSYYWKALFEPRKMRHGNTFVKIFIAEKNDEKAILFCQYHIYLQWEKSVCSRVCYNENISMFIT